MVEKSWLPHPPYITTKQFVFAAKILFLIIAWTA